jgi:glucosamine-6-phosphate deaminase
VDILRIEQFKSKQELDHASATEIIEHVQHNPSAVLGLATGISPIGIYRNMIDAYQSGKVSYRFVRTFNLDEYIGLPAHHPNSYATFMHEHLFKSIDVPSNQIHIPSGTCQDTTVECLRYEKLLKEVGQIDIQIVGIGNNGHIGFNEPAHALTRDTHVVELSEETRQQNQHHFSRPDDFPTHAITMGVGSIMRAKTIMLVAYGAEKSEVIARALQGKITTQLPASLLQLHPNVIVMLDHDASQHLDTGLL